MSLVIENAKNNLKPHFTHVCTLEEVCNLFIDKKSKKKLRKKSDEIEFLELFSNVIVCYDEPFKNNLINISVPNEISTSLNVSSSHSTSSSFTTRILNDNSMQISSDNENSAKTRKISLENFNNTSFINFNDFSDLEPSLSDILNIAIFHAIEKEKDHKIKNILSIGFRNPSEREEITHTGVSLGGIQPSIPQFPNPHVNELSKFYWNTLYKRTGIRFFYWLITSTSLFKIYKDSKFVIQLCGQQFSKNFISYKLSRKRKNFQNYGNKNNNTIDNNNRKKLKKVHPDEQKYLKPNEITLKRYKIFYSKPSYRSANSIRIGLHEMHWLNSYFNPKNEGHVRALMCCIFPIEFKIPIIYSSFCSQLARIPLPSIRQAYSVTMDKASSSKIPSRLFHAPRYFIQSIQMRHSLTRYDFLLNKYCKFNKFYFSRKSSLYSSLDLATSSNTVAAYARSCIENVLPPSAFGSTYNWNIVLKNITKYVKLGKKETLTLHYLLDGIRISDIKWIKKKCSYNGHNTDYYSSLSDHSTCLRIFSQFLFWVFEYFLSYILSGSFYITESAKTNLKTLYFRHDVWKVLQDKEINSMISSSMVSRLSYIEIKAFLSSKKKSQEVLPSNLRFVPKDSSFGLRPVLRMGKKMRMVDYLFGVNKPSIFNHNNLFKVQKTANDILKPLFLALKYELKINKMKGKICGISNQNDLGDLLSNYKNCLLKKTSNSKLPKLYFVKVDIAKCFDTIPQNKAIQELTNLLAESEYSIMSYKKIKTLYSISKNGIRSSLDEKYLEEAVSEKYLYDADNFMNFIIEEWTKKGDSNRNNNEFMKRNEVFFYINNGILGANQSNGNIFIKKKDLVDLLRANIERHVFQFSGKYYRANEGIPQGSSISTTICNILYTAMEKKYLNEFYECEDNLLVRYVDDFLFISPNKNIARKFLNTMRKGIKEYGMRVSLNKTVKNFDKNGEGNYMTGIYSERILYCGLIIDTRNFCVAHNKQMEIYGNYGDHFTVEYSRKPIKTLLKRLCFTMKMQLISATLNYVVNSKSQVLYNIGETIKDTVRRLFEYVRLLSKFHRPSDGETYEIIIRFIRMGYKIILERLKISNINNGQSMLEEKKGFYISFELYNIIVYDAIYRIIRSRRKEYPLCYEKFKRLAFK